MEPIATTKRRNPTFDSKLLHLLDTAAQVFAAEGYDRASMRRVASEAGVSLAGIYHYVAGKEELLYWIQVQTFESLLRGLARSLEGVEDPRERLLAAVRNHLRHFGGRMAELKVCARELETLEGEAYSAVHERRRAYFAAIHDLVRAVVPEPGDVQSTWLATANLFGMLNWFYQWYDPARSRVSLEDLAVQQTALFLDGYIASAPGGDRRGDP
jgi:AcrR family transcriptional regulator